VPQLRPAVESRTAQRKVKSEAQEEEIVHHVMQAAAADATYTVAKANAASGKVRRDTIRAAVASWSQPSQPALSSSL